MAVSDEQAEVWADLIVGRFRHRKDAEHALAAHGLGETDVLYVLDMIDMAYSRAFIYSVGLPPENVQSNVDNDPVFKAALRRFLAHHSNTKAAAASRVPTSPRPWWKFW